MISRVASAVNLAHDAGATAEAEADGRWLVVSVELQPTPSTAHAVREAAKPKSCLAADISTIFAPSGYHEAGGGRSGGLTATMGVHAPAAGGAEGAWLPRLNIDVMRKNLVDDRDPDRDHLGPARIGNKPMTGAAGSIWAKIDATILAGGSGTATSGTSAAPASRKPSKWKFWLLDVIGTVFWVYAAIKVFVFDFDAYLVHRALPEAQWVLDYRFLVFLVLLAIASAFARKWPFLGGLLYIIFFPVVVAVWKIPRFLYRRRSWVAVFASLNVVTNLIHNYRHNLIVAAAALIAGVVIVTFSSGWPLVPAAGVCGVLLILSFGRAIKFALNPSRFVGTQVAVLDKFLMSDALAQSTWLAKDEWRSPQLQKFSREQLAEFSNRMAQGVILHRVVYWWAYHLDVYRRSPAPFVFNVLTYLWLFVEAVAAYALINAALFKFDPHAFRYTNTPGAFDFVHYAINALLAGSVDYLSPRTPVAVALFDAAHLTGILIFLTFFATLFFVIRQTKQDEALRESVETFRQRGREFEQRFTEQYEITIAEAIDRLKEFGSGLLGIIAFFSTRIPPGFEGDPDSGAAQGRTGSRATRP